MSGQSTEDSKQKCSPEDRTQVEARTREAMERRVAIADRNPKQTRETEERVEEAQMR